MNKKITIGIIILALAVLVWHLLKPKAREESDNYEDGENEEESVFPLKEGSKSNEVKNVNIYLFRTYGAKFPVGINDEWHKGNVKKFLDTDEISEEFYNNKIK